MEPDREYYHWRVQAEKNGLSHLAATAYYLDDSKRLYGIYVDGDPITAPIFSYRDWVHKSDSEYPIGSISTDNPVSDYNEKVIEEIERVISFRKTGKIESEIGTIYGTEKYMLPRDLTEIISTLNFNKVITIRSGQPPEFLKKNSINDYMNEILNLTHHSKRFKMKSLDYICRIEAN